MSDLSQVFELDNNLNEWYHSSNEILITAEEWGYAQPAATRRKNGYSSLCSEFGFLIIKFLGIGYCYDYEENT